MQHRNVRAVLFDWDGTLVDTAESTYRCYVRMFADFGIAFDRELYARTYSPNWHHTYRCVDLPEHRWTEADTAWHGYFAEETTVLIDGALEVLQTLAGRDVIQGIVTSGTRNRSSPRSASSIISRAWFAGMMATSASRTRRR